MNVGVIAVARPFISTMPRASFADDETVSKPAHQRPGSRNSRGTGLQGSAGRVDVDGGVLDSVDRLIPPVALEFGHLLALADTSHGALI